MVMKRYDVVIVGAGPGGLKCAEILSQSDKSVLLLEKNEEIGPKVCAGGLTRKSFRYLDPPDRIIEKVFDRVIFKTFKRETILPFGENLLYTINRKNLGQWQLSKLKNTAVEIKAGELVTEVNSDYIVTNKSGKIGYSHLVGADGSNSIVRRYLGLETKLTGAAFHYLVPTKKYNDIELFFDSRLFHSWYSWIFPCDEYASIGYGYFPKIISSKKAREGFDQWIKKNNIDISGGKFQAHPLNCDYQGYRFGNVFLIGDAAGLVSGFTGEGIYQALVSGEEAAKSIINPLHKSRRISELRREVQIHHFMLRIVRWSGPLRNFLFNLVIFSVRSKFIARTLLRILT